MKTQMIDIGKLEPYDRNPRINDQAVPKVADSIARYGFLVPIVCDPNFRIASGHTRYKAGLQLGLDQVPVIIKEFESEEEFIGFNLADNATAEIALWDEAKRNELVAELKDQDFDMSAIGFSQKNIDKILHEIEKEMAGNLNDLDEVPDSAPEVCSEGDLWLLGDHRLLCGDSTDIENVRKVMDGKKANIVFTDPPYNVDYGASKNPRHKIREIENDAQKPEDWIDFNKRIIEVIKEICSGDVYVWGGSGFDGMKQRLMFIEAGLHWSATIIWKKQQLVLSPAKYQRIYEPCLYGWFGKSTFKADRKQTEVWEFDRPRNSKLHPTMKPIDLCANGIMNSSWEGDIVWDGFLGSGSTLVCCEKLRRICYGMELDPKYCDIIIKRWEEFSGRKAVKHGC